LSSPIGFYSCPKSAARHTFHERSATGINYCWLGFIVPDDELDVSSEDSGGCPVSAADPGGAELCSLAPVEESPLAPVDDLFETSLPADEPGGAELCSLAPLEVSLPAAFAPAGGLDGFIVSAARTGLALRNRIAAALIK
jgi:hypothetical protein